jgi:hypothetical protein
MYPIRLGRSTAHLLVVAAVFGLATASMDDARALSSGNGDLRVMTYNVDQGTDFANVAQATNQFQFLVAVGQTISQVRATQPHERMKAVARQIVAAGPTLVSLQEVNQWFSGEFDPATGCGPLSLEFDMLKDLLDALAAQGAHYTVVVTRQQFAIPPLPGLILPGTFLCAAVVNNVVLLARDDLKSSRFSWSNPQSATYQHTLSFPTPFGTLPLPRAWVSVDATFNGKSFRFIGTHLESTDASLRRLQGVELRAGPGATTLPIVIAMDSNAQAAPLPLDPAYADFIAAGYDDAWARVFPSVAGFTCCQNALLTNVESQLTQRIDLILARGPITPQNVALYGIDLASKTTTGLWPSDHAGVAAQLAIRGFGTP